MSKEVVFRNPQACKVPAQDQYISASEFANAYPYARKEKDRWADWVMKALAEGRNVRILPVDGREWFRLR